MTKLNSEIAAPVNPAGRARRSGRRLARALTLGALALALAGQGRAQPQPAPAPSRVVGAALSAVTGGAELDIVGTEPLRWAVRPATGNLFVLELAGALPGEGLTDLQATSGIVDGVTFEAGEGTDPPSTRVLVRTREAVQHQVAADGRVLTLRFTPAVAAGAVGEPPAAPAPPLSSPAPARAPAPIPRPPSSGEALAEYTIGPGDVVSVSVFGVEELDRRTRVQADGTVALPLVGRVKIAGLSLTEAEAEVGRQLHDRQLVNSPQVLVVIEEYASYGVTVQGAVVRPGVYPVIGRQSLLEVLWAAGGLVDTATADQKILVLRQDASGRSERIEVDAYRLLDEGDASLNLSLNPGDRVVVPKPQKYTVYVSGAVRRPGPVEFGSSAGLTVLQAITLAGGPTERANLGKVTIIRQVEDGGQETIKVNLKKIQKGKAQDVFLKNSDTVQVGVWFF